MFGSKLVTLAVTQILYRNTGKQINNKVLTGHCEGLGYREFHLVEAGFLMHFRTVLQFEASSEKTEWQVADQRYFDVCCLQDNFCLVGPTALGAERHTRSWSAIVVVAGEM